MNAIQTQTMIRQLGNAAAVARALQPFVPAGQTLSRSAVAQWRRVPAEYVIPLEQVSQGRYTREEIRPDIFRPVHEIPQHPSNHAGKQARA